MPGDCASCGGCGSDFKANEYINPQGYSAGQVYRIFSSGAENGYLGRESYSVPPDEKYFAEFRRLVWDSIMEQSDLNGMVCLQFNRVYLVARK